MGYSSILRVEINFLVVCDFRLCHSSHGEFGCVFLDYVLICAYLFSSIRIFSIAATICISLVLPLNYYGHDMEHKVIPSESLEVFSIANVQKGSKRYKRYFNFYAIRIACSY